MIRLIVTCLLLLHSAAYAATQFDGNVDIGTGFTMGDKEAISIYLSYDDNHYIEITLHRDNLYQGFHVTSMNRSHAHLIDIMGNWNGTAIYHSHYGNSLIDLKVIEFDPAITQAQIEFTGVFYDREMTNRYDFGPVIVNIRCETLNGH